MKISKAKLQQIIKEEIARVISEQEIPVGADIDKMGDNIHDVPDSSKELDYDELEAAKFIQTDRGGGSPEEKELTAMFIKRDLQKKLAEDPEFLEKLKEKFADDPAVLAYLGYVTKPAIQGGPMLPEQEMPASVDD